ncbi:MAG: branched-chain amino acid transaminase [Candidatus Zixiibacteriota bacterium]
MTPVEYIWMNGKLVKWDDAKIHVLSHVVHYGTSVFEGMRCYKTPKGPACFRLNDHTQRLRDSAKIYRMRIPYTDEEINEAILNLIGANKLGACYVRPVVYRGYKVLGVDPTPCPVEFAIGTWAWGKYLGEDAMENGVSVCFSSWNRIAPNTMPAMAKAGGNYLNSGLIKMEAASHGYVEGIALDVNGNVSEGSAENIFLVRKGALITPTFAASILPGITRSSVIRLAEEMGIKVIEQNVPREAVYLSDEVFFTGSAAEITPISKVDNIQIGSGKRGPITEALQKAFFDIIEGRAKDRFGWLTYVPEYKGVAVS